MCIRSLVPSANLLEFNVKEGWGPLCQFLGVAEPLDSPFPHENKVAQDGNIIDKWKNFPVNKKIRGEIRRLESLNWKLFISLSATTRNRLRKVRSICAARALIDVFCHFFFNTSFII